jgi:hypothetical protein
VLAAIHKAEGGPCLSWLAGRVEIGGRNGQCGFFSIIASGVLEKRTRVATGIVSCKGHPAKRMSEFGKDMV